MGTCERCVTPREPLELRPYQLVCLTCGVGDPGATDGCPTLAAARETIRSTPDVPIRLACNAGDVFWYQDPGLADDRHGGAELNRRRDLEILRRLDLPPGATLPARILLYRIWERIEGMGGICGPAETMAEGWEGCPWAGSGAYERGRELSLSLAVLGCGSCMGFGEADLPDAESALIVPRPAEERDAEKRRSLAAMAAGEAIPVRPHILLCAVSQYGSGLRPPYEADNLPELLELIIADPGVRVRMAEAADWMMCAPCPSYQPELGACLNAKGSGGLTNQLRDVNMLRVLGMRYGDVMNARELYRLIFERIPSPAPICSVSRGVHEPSVWYDGCGASEEICPMYDAGRRALEAAFEGETER